MHKKHNFAGGQTTLDKAKAVGISLMMQVASRFNESLSSLDLNDLDLRADDERSLRDERKRVPNDEPMPDDDERDYDPPSRERRKKSSSVVNGSDRVIMSVLLENERAMDSGGACSQHHVSSSKAMPVPSESLTPQANDTDNESLTTIETQKTKEGKKKVSLTTLIANQKGGHILQRIQNHPRSLRRRHSIQLNGRPTRAHPLHHLVSMKPPAKVVRAFIEIYPEACRLPDEMFGQLPLHIAANFGATTAVMKCLLYSFPDAAKLRDVDDRLPLHYACHDCHATNVSLLISANKSALSARESHGKTPVDLCQESQSPNRDAVLNLIFREVSNEYGMEFKKTERNVRSPSDPDSKVPLPSRSETPVENVEDVSGRTASTCETSGASQSEAPAETSREVPRGSNGNHGMIQDANQEDFSLRTIETSNRAPNGIARNEGGATLRSQAREEVLPFTKDGSKSEESLYGCEVPVSDLDSSSRSSDVSDLHVESALEHAGEKPDLSHQKGESTEGSEKSRSLLFRKAALKEECSHVKVSIAEKKALAQASKNNMSKLTSKIRELQEAFEKERKAFDIASSGVKVYEEILSEHEAKIQVVDKELSIFT